MKKLIKIILIGYAVLWAYEQAKKMLQEKDVNNFADLKDLIKKSIN
jgi:hypothetical protein